MNKKEILAEIAGKFDQVGMVSFAENEAARAAKAKGNEYVTWYLVGAFKADGKTLVRQNVSIYVANEGTDKEQAWYHPDSYRMLFPEPAKEVSPAPTPDPVAKPAVKSKNWFQKIFKG
jgi:hypothetical protein